MREIININKNWYFSKEAKDVPTALPEGWELLDLPYTFNGKDGQDGGNDYYRGTGYFAKMLRRSDMPKGDEVYLQLDGVNLIGTVYFNGKMLATHENGYSSFRVKLENIKDENLLVVIADNSPNDYVYPQTADFTFYGGIYRDVTLIGVSKHHFDLDFFASPGIKVTAKAVDFHLYDVNLQAYCKGDVEFEIKSDGEVVTKIRASGKNPCATVSIKNPRLWDGIKDPYLYTATAYLYYNGEVCDEISTRFGCRKFEITPDGFILNGSKYPLRGVSRHQDRPGIGNALLEEHHREDIDLICEMGANSIRLAHYQHSRYFYDLCDERGIIVWAEIPYISKHLQNGVQNTMLQMKELIYQNYNHPSIAVWGLSNEITMGGVSRETVKNHRMLNDLAHSLDENRQTVEAVLSTCPINEEYIHIPDAVSYNHYFGWYGGSADMYGKWFDNFHSKYPDTPIGLSEYGCEALNWHSSSPEQGDYTEEYQAKYHETLIKQIAKRPYLWSTYVWNMFDFAADARAEGGENGINHKGLVTFDRKYKKDSFYAYKAWLSDSPTLHICSKRYIDRVEDETKITVYSNQDEVELFANGVSAGKQKKGEFPFFYFTVKNEGETVITAKAGALSDEAVIRKVDKFNESYRLKEAGAVINWFEIETPQGRYSINDTVGDIISTFKGKLVALKILKMLKANTQRQNGGKKGAEIMGFKLSDVNKSVIEMAKSFTVKRALMMLGNKFTKEQILEINSALNKIKKSGGFNDKA